MYKVGEPFIIFTLMEPTREDYITWLKLRNENKNEYGEKLCYCSHTKFCMCDDPDFETFKHAVKFRWIILNDPNNGWKHVI